VAAGRWAFSSARRAFVAVVAHVSLVYGDIPGLELRWSAPADCPTRRDVLRSVEQLLAGGSAAELRADARVVKRTDGFVLALDWSTRDASATRVLEGESCQELAQAAALMLALAAEPKTTSAPSPPRYPNTPDETPAKAAVARPSPSAASPAAPETDHVTRSRTGPPPLTLSARAGAAVDAGSLPRATVGVLGGASIRLGAASLRLDALLFAPKEEEKPFGGGRFWLGTAAVSPCYGVSFGAVTLEPCAAAELHVVPSRGLRLRSREERTALLVRLGAGAEADLELTRSLGAFVGIWGLWAPARPRFVVDGQSMFRPPALVPRAELGFEYAF
jgi:hypothetical protein